MAKEDDKQPQQTPGEILSKARKKAKFTPKTVAKRLFIRQLRVESIEKDEYDPSLSQTFWRGYIRAYGKLLNISEKELAAACDRVLSPPDEQPMSTIIRPRTTASSIKFGEPKKSRKWTWIITSTLIILVIIIWANQRQEQGNTQKNNSEKASSTTKKKQIVTPLELPPETEKSLLLPTPQVQTKPKPTSKKATFASRTRQLKKISTKPSTTKQIPSTTKQIPSTTKQIPSTTKQIPSTTKQIPSTTKRKPTRTIPPKQALTIKAKHNTWVNIRNQQGKIIFSGPILAEQTKNMEYHKPFSIFMSSTKGINIALDGKSIDLSKYKGKEDVEIKINHSTTTQ